MLDGVILKSMEKTVFRTSDIRDYCKLDLRQNITFNEYYKELNGELTKLSGVIVADYEHFIVVRTEKGYNICISKRDLATGWSHIDNFDPKVPKIFSWNSEQEK